MSAQAISATSLICASQSRRALTLRGNKAATRDSHATEFPEGMLDLGRQPLAKGDVRVLPAIDATLVCLEGELWLTRDGDAEDYILSAGACLHLGRADQAMVQALRPSRLRLIAA